MTTVYHTDIAAGAPANASTLNAPLGELDAALVGFKAGTTPLTKLSVGTDTTLTIASDAITVTKARHLIDTEGAAATDNLATINGGVEGDILFLQIVNNARTVTLKASGNIFPATGGDLLLDNVYDVAALLYDGAKWCQIDPAILLKTSTYNSYVLPDNSLAVRPAPFARNSWDVKAAAATIAQNGIAAPSTVGTVSASNDTDSTYNNFLTGAVAGNGAGVSSATFNLVRRSHNPIFHCLLRTGAAADIANIRMWIGLGAAAATYVDVSASQFVGFRFSSITGDAGFVPVCYDGTTQNVGAVLGGTLAATTRYLLSFQVNDLASTVKFWVNNGTPVTLSANLPAAATELGFSAYLYTTAAVAKNFKISRIYCEYD